MVHNKLDPNGSVRFLGLLIHGDNGAKPLQVSTDYADL